MSPISKEQQIKIQTRQLTNSLYALGNQQSAMDLCQGNPDAHSPWRDDFQTADPRINRYIDELAKATQSLKQIRADRLFAERELRQLKKAREKKEKELEEVNKPGPYLGFEWPGYGYGYGRQRRTRQRI